MRTAEIYDCYYRIVFNVTAEMNLTLYPRSATEQDYIDKLHTQSESARDYIRKNSGLTAAESLRVMDRFIERILERC